MKIKDTGTVRHVSTPHDSVPMTITLEQHPHLRDVIANIRAKAYLARQGGAK